MVKLDNQEAALSGAVGGPATAKGVTYQVLYAAKHAIEMLETFVANGGLPLCTTLIQMESRSESNTTLTGWDIRLLLSEESEVRIETKIKLGRNDVPEFCRRVVTHKIDTTTRFRLVYGESSPGYLKDLNQLKRLALETTDKSDFAKRIREENLSRNYLLKDLGQQAWSALRQIDLCQSAPESLRDDVQHAARRLVGSHKSEQLIDSLFRRLQTASMCNREALLIRRLYNDLVETFGEMRLTSRPQPNELTDIAHLIAGAIWPCQHPVPVSPIAKSLGISEASLASQLEPFQRAGGISIVDGSVALVLKRGNWFPE